MATWTEEETIQLIDLWGEESVQEHLEKCSKNRNVYEKIATEMRAAGYERTAVQCRDKIKKLRAEYKRTKDYNGLTGRGTRKWRYYDQLDAILGNRPASRPPIVLDTSDEARIVIECGTEDCEDEVEPGIDYVDEADEEDNHEENKLEGKTTNMKTEKKTSNEKKNTNRKRPTSAQLVEKAIGKSMDQVARAQEQSDEHFLALEEKRLKFDERVFELENKRWKEDKDREEQRCREEREFQLQVYQHLADCVLFVTVLIFM